MQTVTHILIPAQTGKLPSCLNDAQQVTVAALNPSNLKNKIKTKKTTRSKI